MEKDRKFSLKCAIVTIILLTIAVIVLLVATILFALETLDEEKMKSTVSTPKTTDFLPTKVVNWFGTISATVEEVDEPTSLFATQEATSKFISTPNVNEQCFRIGTTPGFYEASTNILNSMNFSVDPCEDFYQFACGTWPLRNPRPKNKSSFTAYTLVRDTVSEKILTSINNISLNHSKSEQLLKLVYSKCVNDTEMNHFGGKPLLDLFHDLGTWPIIDYSNWNRSNFRLERLLATMKRNYGVDVLFHIIVRAYEFNSSQAVLQLNGAFLPLGLGSFTAKYYLNDHSYGNVLNAYVQLIVSSASLLLSERHKGGYVDQSQAIEIVRFEKLLANLSQTAFEREFGLEKWSLTKLQKEFGGFDWNMYFRNVLPDEILTELYNPNFEIQLVTPIFIRNLLQLLQSTPAQTIQNYAIWRLVKYSLPYLGTKFRNVLEAFETVYHGNQDPITIRDSCMELIKGRYDLPGLGYVTGKVFVGDQFNGAKFEVERMVEHIKQGFGILVNQLSWMDNGTKSEAIKKLRGMIANVQYPDWIVNETLLDHYYTGLKISNHQSMFEIYFQIRSWAVEQNFLLLLKPMNRKEFGGSPAATDAWYGAGRNALSIPAGELQRPFYDKNYPKAVNFGAIGAVIGHEMSHGFDLVGSTFDSVGNLNNWWSEKSMREFINRTMCIREEYNNFCFHEIGCIDGFSTVSENIADLAGLKAAYTAYMQLMKVNGEEPRLPRLESFSLEQIFFLSFASFWCGSSTKEHLRNQVHIDKHTPGQFRVVGTLRNMEQFAKAFQCPIGSYMNPRKKCSVW